MLRILKFLAIVVVGLLGMTFFVMNSHDVEVNYYFDQTTTALSNVMALMLGIGVLLGLLAGLVAMFPLKRENARLRKKVRIAEEEVSNLRSIPIKDAL